MYLGDRLTITYARLLINMYSGRNIVYFALDYGMVVIPTASRLLAIVAGQTHKPGTDAARMSGQEYGSWLFAM